MFIWGRVIGSILGMLAFKGIPGLFLGFVIGYFFDRSIGQLVAANESVEGDDSDVIKQMFMKLLFTSLGHLAKSDGRISEAEVQQTEHIIKDFSLSEEEREQAIEWFQQGAKQENDYDDLLRLFTRHALNRPELKQVLLEVLISLALADGKLDDAEESILRHVAGQFGIGRSAFEKLLGLLRAQHHFHKPHAEPAEDTLAQAYQALGVSEADSDQDIKRAYRKLMSQHHPDKLIAQGVPEDAIKIATEQSQAIQQAYDLIKKSRKS